MINAVRDKTMLNTNGKLLWPNRRCPCTYKALYQMGPNTLSNAMRDARSPANSPWGNPDADPCSTKAATIPIDCADPKHPMARPHIPPLYPKNDAPIADIILDSMAKLVYCRIPNRCNKRPPNTLATTPFTPNNAKKDDICCGERFHSDLAKIKKKSPINIGNVCSMSKIPNMRTFLP